MERRPKRQTERLLKGRVSLPNRSYFLTLCTRDRRPGLDAPNTAKRILDTWRQQHRDGDYRFHCATIMPDHVHWLCTLGERLSLASVISKFKSQSQLTRIRDQQAWQRNYYDHRLRIDHSMESFARYIFVNPYRKDLITPNAFWPLWICSREYVPEFTEHLIDKKYPPPEWIQNASNVDELIKKDTVDHHR